MNRFTFIAILLFTLAALCAPCDCRAASGAAMYPAEAFADSATTTLINRFWNNSGGYFNERSDSVDGCGGNYWPQAHAMDVIIDAYERTGADTLKSMFAKWLEGVILQNDGGHTGGYTNDYYDDEAWIALTMVRLYNATGDKRFLTVAKNLFSDIASGWNDTFADGGVAWRKSQPWSKNACINGPASLLAFKLYRATGNEDYARFGLKTYEWLRTHLLDPATGEVQDNINGQTGHVEPWHFTYNQGTVAGAALEAYRYAHRTEYLSDACRAADYGLTAPAFVNPAIGAVTLENGSIPANGDGALFRAVFFRYLAALATAPELAPEWRSRFCDSISSNASYLWGNAHLRGSDALFGTNWSCPLAPGESTGLNAQVSACTLLEMNARLNIGQ